MGTAWTDTEWIRLAGHGQLTDSSCEITEGVWISSFRKLHYWTVAGDRTIALLSSGNLAANIAHALTLDRAACIDHAKHYSWESATDMFEDALIPLGPSMAARSMHSA